MQNKASDKRNETAKKVMGLLRPYSGFLLLSLLCALGTVVTTLLIPILSGKAIDHMTGQGKVDFPGLVLVLKQIAVVAAGTFIFQLIMNRINNYITYSVTRNLRQQAFEKLLVQPVAVIDRESHGDIVSRIVTDADSFSDGLLLGFTQLFTGIMTIIGTIGFMLQIRVSIALVVILLTPVSLKVAKFIAGRSYRMFSAQSRDRGELTEFLQERITLSDLVNQLGYREKTREEFLEKNRTLTESAMKATFYSSLTNPSTRFINALIYAAVGVAGSLVAIAGGITVGQLSSFLGYAREYARPFNEITGVVTEMQNAMACAQRLFAIIESKPVENGTEHLPEKVEGKVEMRHVDFSYDPQVKLIRDLSFTARPGETVAIVGPTGAGKSTIINLLMRFYDVNAGEVRVEGRDIRELDRASLRSRYGMVLQETFLFSGTIRENLMLGKPKATEEEMVAAAKAAHAHSFIRRLPKGYDTYLAPEGGSLSQGQKQLL
ncbi:MAG: ABC transporter ATP-binding protein, partial [Candidatus Weimeria sp.]|nr:ABC transporter ATP-binding protein [Candidatus Weimeria sp.]